MILSDKEILERENQHTRQLVRQVMEKPQIYEREFLTRCNLPRALEKIWKKGFSTPLKTAPDYLPRYAYG